MAPVGEAPGHGAAVAGVLAGVAQVVAEHPLDTLKARMQTLARPDLRAHDGSLSVLRATVAREGGSALFRGIVPRLLTYGAVKGSLFNIYEALRRTPVGERSPALAGALAGLLNCPLSCAPEVVKSQCQVGSHDGVGSGVAFARATMRIVSLRGPRGLFAGLLPLCVRDCVGYCALFCVYEQRRALPHVPMPVLGGLAGCAFYVVALPADRVRTVLMTQSLAEPRFRTAMDAARAVLAQAGLLGFYRGLAPTLARTFMGQAVALTVYARASAVLQRRVPAV
ncbi:hypothetical protein KFE25_012950 [Diacronema lutheri]|uniref:Uncharacterized protein n=2 Tax=Diacronema lutheri TaxID=2081491 RepID=A0A8J6C1E7_DIALT|nr:hypothetical protein KFE25_012950 [Diacronema lutheri]